MTEAHEVQEEPAEEVGSSIPTLLDSLRGHREDVEATKDITMSVPGYKGDLHVQYRLLDNKQVNEILKRAQKEHRKDQSEAEVIASVDLLVTACIQFYGLRPTGLVPLHEVADGAIGEFPHPIRYGDDLGRVIGFEATTARDAVFKLFGHNDLSILAHARALQLWFANTNADIDTSFLGEA